MNEINKNNHNLSIKDLISENFLRDLILFTFIFVLITSQTWDNVFLLLFPLITFIFSMFFRILSTNKKKTEFEKSYVIYNPLGSEVKNADRLFFITIFQMILIFWFGAESLYNPHLINNLHFYFTGILVFAYTFAFFWIFIDFWNYSHFEIITKEIDDELNSHISTDSKKTLSFLKLKNFKIISIVNITVFLVLNTLNLIILFLINDNTFIMVHIYLPGLQLISFSSVLYVILIITPIIALFIFILNYRTINNINKENIDSIIEILPRNLQINIIENLKSLNEKIKQQIKRE